MIEQLSTPTETTFFPPPAPEVQTIEVSYDSENGVVTYNGQRQIALSITVPTRIDLTLLTKGPMPREASFYGFSIHPEWPIEIEVLFPDNQQMQVLVTDPQTPSGTFNFTPLIQATGQRITSPGSVTLTVTGEITGEITGKSAATGSPDPNRFTVTYENGTIQYDPHSITVPPADTPTTITAVIDAPGVTFYGFAFQSGWLPDMSISMNTSLISILDPNLASDPSLGNFSFVTLVQAPDGALGANRNPDPTIVNTDIPPFFVTPPLTS